MTTSLPRLGDADQQQLTVLVEQSLNALETVPLAGVVILKPVAIGTTDTRVYHGLGQRITGYWLVQAPSDVRVFDGVAAEANDPAHFVTLRLSTAATVTLAVF